jgi:hypothetical protein
MEAVFVLFEYPSPLRRIFIGSHSLPPLWFAASVLHCAIHCWSSSTRRGCTHPPALLHPEVGHPIIIVILPSFRQANLKKYRKRCQCAPIPRYPSHSAPNAAICWMLFGLRCWSYRPYSKSTARTNRLMGCGEAALVKHHERDDVTQRRAWHGLVLGHLPFLGVSERG